MTGARTHEQCLSMDVGIGSRSHCLLGHAWINFQIDTLTYVGKFYGAFNNILNVLDSRRDEMLAVRFVKTYCLPSLLYRCEIWRLNNTDARSIDVAWNNAFRKFLTVKPTGTRVWSCYSSTVNVCLFLCWSTCARSCFGEKCFILAMLYCTLLLMNVDSLPQPLQFIATTSPFTILFIVTILC